MVGTVVGIISCFLQATFGLPRKHPGLAGCKLHAAQPGKHMQPPHPRIGERGDERSLVSMLRHYSAVACPVRLGEAAVP